MSAPTNRREFLKKSESVLAATALGGAAIPQVHAAGRAVLRLGLVGCGGRGTGAVGNALKPECNRDVVLWALADLFPDKVDAALKSLTALFKHRVQVPPERQFTGFEGYRGVMEHCDVVLVCIPPRFTAEITLDAVKANRHVFFEIIGAVDMVRIQKVIEAERLAARNGTSLICGHCYRFHLARREAARRMQDGQIGEITSIQCDYMRGWYRRLDHHPQWSELEYQIRNWNWFNWLNGGHVANTLSHNIDSALWVLGDQRMPETAYGVGGRSTHIHPSRGTSFDHASVVYEFPHGLKLYGFIRNANNCFNSNRDIYHGTKGRCYFQGFRPPYFTDLKDNVVWRADEKLARASAYEQEQIELLNSVRTGQPVHQGTILADCAVTCLMGQLAIFTGKRLSRQQVVDSQFAYLPDGQITWETDPPVKPGSDGLYPVPVPGETSLTSRLAQLAGGSGRC